jgi:TPP-dependent pyruvate/acetoin dehydrogenase alpha subunit
MTNWSLGHLSDSTQLREPLDVAGQDRGFLLQQLEMMLRIRQAERCLANGRRDGIVGGPVHLGIGQEAVAVGVASVLRKTDRVFGGHRSHSHVLSMGGSMYRLFAEVLARETGMSRGMGGSMHLWDQPNGFYGAVPIVAGTVPLAVGAGLAAKFQGTQDIGVAYLGDGAMEEGVVHESLNLSRMLKAPILFVVENNFFASHMHISLRQPSENMSRFAAVNFIEHAIVDGNDVVKMQHAADRLVQNIRSGRGPGFLEAITFRWFGHVDWREDIDVGVHRSADEVGEWRRRDPVARLYQGLCEAGWFDEERMGQLEERIDQEVRQAWNHAVNDDPPSSDAITSYVYGSKTV